MLWCASHAEQNHVSRLSAKFHTSCLRSGRCSGLMLQDLRKKVLQVLAKCSQIAYDRLYIIRDYVNRNWSGAQYMAGWEFDYVSLRPPSVYLCCFLQPSCMHVLNLLHCEQDRPKPAPCCAKDCLSPCLEAQEVSSVF